MIEVELTDAGKTWIQEHHPQGIIREYDPDKPFKLHSVAAEFVELTYLGVSYRIPHMTDDKPTIAKTHTRMPDEILPKTAVILPETAVNWAWGLTLKYSEKMEGKIDAEYTQQQMKEIKENTKKNTLEASYLDNLYSAVDAAVRTLVITINGRNHNFKEVNALIDLQSSIIDDTERVTANLQSLAPRLATITVGGATLPSLFKWILPLIWPWDSELVISDNVFRLLMIFAIGVTYWFHEVFVVRWRIKKHQRLLIFGEYNRNLYYRQWVMTVRSTLESLLENSINIYESYYDTKKYENKLIPWRKKFVDDLTKGIEPKYWCKHVHKCMAKNRDDTKKDVIDFDKWGNCESGEGKEECEEYKKLENIAN